LARKGIISTQGLKTLSRLVVEVSLPALIFSRLLSDFNFQRFPDWWLFPLISFGLTLFGLAIGYLFLKADKSLSQKNEFLGLIAFQNSGYLPLALAATILPPSEADQMFIYIFLFLLGFNALIWSFGVHLLSKHRGKRFEFGSVFTPPLWATLGALLIIFLKAESFVPRIVLKPLAMLGACAIPLGLMIVGGSLAFVSSEGKIRKRSLINLGLGKLIILPILVFLFIIWIKPPRLIGLLLPSRQFLYPHLRQSWLSLHRICGHQSRQYKVFSPFFALKIVFISNENYFLVLNSKQNFCNSPKFVQLRKFCVYT